MAKKPAYKIAEACKLLDVQPYVLRYWEREFPFLASGESRGGQRVYSPEDLAVIRRIKTLLYEEGYTIAGAKRKLEGELGDGGVAAAGEALTAPPSIPAARASDGSAKPKSPRSVQPRGASAAPPAATDPPSEGEASLDTSSTERVETLLAGVRGALGRSREILRLLESPPGRA